MIKSSLTILKPYLHGTIKQAPYEKIVATLSKLPVSTHLYGKDIQAGKLLSDLFPALSGKIHPRGLLSFSLTTHQMGPDNVLIKLALKLRKVKIDTPSFTIGKAILTCNFILSPSRRLLAGDIRCTLMNPIYVLPGPKTPTRINISKAVIAGNLANRVYTITMRAQGISCPTLPLGSLPLRGISIGTLSLSPGNFVLDSLKARYLENNLQIDQAVLDLSSLSFKTGGNVALSWPLALEGVSSVKKLTGEIAWNVKGNLSVSPATFTGNIQGKRIRLLLSDGSLPLDNMIVRVTSRNGSLEVPKLQFSYGHGVMVSGSAFSQNMLHPLTNLQSNIRLESRNVQECLPIARVVLSLPATFSCSGPFSLKARLRIDQKATRLRGTAHYHGDIADTSLPLSCKDLTLFIPFDLKIVSDRAPIDNFPDSIKGEKGMLKAKSIELGILKITDLDIHLTSGTNILEADKISFGFFQGVAKGKGRCRILPPFPWQITLNAHGISLHDICNHVPDFKDALSGRVKTTLTLHGIGGKLSNMKGKFFAETVKSPLEPLRISQEFIRKLTGKKGRLFFFRKYRPYNKGIIRARIEKGTLIFDTLELSHKFLGFKDLSIAVSRFSNRIGLDDLIWEILQASKAQIGTPVIKTD